MASQTTPWIMLLQITLVWADGSVECELEKSLNSLQMTMEFLKHQKELSFYPDNCMHSPAMKQTDIDDLDLLSDCGVQSCGCGYSRPHITSLLKAERELMMQTTPFPDSLPPGMISEPPLMDTSESSVNPFPGDPSNLSPDINLPVFEPPVINHQPPVFEPSVINPPVFEPSVINPPVFEPPPPISLTPPPLEESTGREREPEDWEVETEQNIVRKRVFHHPFMPNLLTPSNSLLPPNPLIPPALLPQDLFRSGSDGVDAPIKKDHSTALEIPEIHWNDTNSSSTNDSDKVLS